MLPAVHPAPKANARHSNQPVLHEQLTASHPAPKAFARHLNQPVLHEQLTASHAARTQLRDSLLSYLRTTPDPQTPVAAPVQAQPSPESQPQPEIKLLIGEPRQLMLSLWELAICCNTLSESLHRNQALDIDSSKAPNLDWLYNLMIPAKSLDHSGTSEIDDLIALRAASREASHPHFDSFSEHGKREAVFQLARELPYFNRPLTVSYLQPRPNVTREYELHVAHSILRMAPKSTTLDDFLHDHFPAWRQRGLLHVLALAAVHMPSPTKDWRIPDSSPLARPLATLLHALNTARAYSDATSAISTFIAAVESNPDPVAMENFTFTLDRIAVLMRVKSNPPAFDAASHSLDHAIATHLPNPDQWPSGPPTPDQLTSIWGSIKPALERALPPSMLLLGGECW
jgi:hypothetical protein